MSSQKQYDIALRRWWNFAKFEKIDKYNPTVSTLLTFLQSSYDQGAGHSTLGTYRSAVALLSPTMNGRTIGEHKLVTRFMKGVSKLRPPKPRYQFTWDPAPVLVYLSTLQSLDSILQLQLLTEKLLMLLALSTGQRMQTLHAIDTRNIENISDGVQIKVDKLLKTSKPGSFQPCLYLPKFDSQVEVCPVRTLVEYLSRTQSFRTEKKFQLFLSSKTHNPVTTQTMSKWVKNVLKRSGVNSDVFCAHSTRHASTSLAARSGVSTDQIFATAGWSNNSSTFARFYNRPVVNRGSFAESILSASKQ